MCCPNLVCCHLCLLCKKIVLLDSPIYSGNGRFYKNHDVNTPPLWRGWNETFEKRDIMSADASLRARQASWAKWNPVAGGRRKYSADASLRAKFEAWRRITGTQWSVSAHNGSSAKVSTLGQDKPVQNIQFPPIFHRQCVPGRRLASFFHPSVLNLFTSPHSSVLNRLTLCLQLLILVKVLGNEAMSTATIRIPQDKQGLRRWN